MIGKHKPFNKEWHKSSDLKARAYGKNLFRWYGYDAQDNEDKYGIDLIVYDGRELICYAEVEIKKYLSNFTFDTLHILERKKKYFVHPSGKPVLFCLFSPNGNVCAMTRGDYMLSMEPQHVKNTAVEKGEYFYKVPISKVRMIHAIPEGLPQKKRE
jgi:hypothetical protein